MQCCNLNYKNITVQAQNTAHSVTKLCCYAVHKMQVKHTLISSGVNCSLKVVGNPGPTLCPTSCGLIILKYGESACVTFTNLGT